MAETIPCRKVFKFRIEPTEREARALERTASVARYIYNWGLARCRQYYQQHGKSKPWAELSTELTQLKAVVLYVLALVAVVVGVDVLFFRNPVLAAADGEPRNRPGVRGVLPEIPEASMSAAAAMRAHPV